MKSLVKLHLFTLLFIALSINLHADVGHFDVYTIKWKSQQYYLILESVGQLKDNDLCYYDYNENYKMEVQDYVDRTLALNHEIWLYKEVAEIHVDSFRTSNGKPAGLESPLFILNGRFQVRPDSVLGHYELQGAKKGHTYGTLISPLLTEDDNQWIDRSNMKNVALVDNGECIYYFYSSRIVPDSREASVLQKELEALMPIGEAEVDRISDEKFWKRINGLIEEETVMIGGCSC